MWSPSDEFKSIRSSYINSDYSLNSITKEEEEEGGESSHNLFNGDWFSSEYSSDSQVQSEMDISSSSLSLLPFPLTPNSSSHSVGEGDGSVKSVGLTNGEIQFNGEVQLLVDPMTELVGSEKVIGEGDGSSREAKRLKLRCQEKIPVEASSSTKKNLAKGTGKKSQKILPKVTALQQLVSPFGKTDTSSVLEATARKIKELHEEIKILTVTAPYMGGTGTGTFHQQILSGPYMGGGNDTFHQQVENADRIYTKFQENGWSRL